MTNFGISLSYTSNLYGTIERRIETPLHFVDGMPDRERYEADQGWDELFQVKPAKEQVRRGATALDRTAKPSAPGRRDREVEQLET